MLGRGEAVPHFRVTTMDGRTVDYSSMWQRRNLVLVTLSEADAAPAETYASALTAGRADVQRHETDLVVTRDAVVGCPSPGVVIADRWGEIVHVAGGADVAALPRLPDNIDWVAHLQTRCPESEGEAR
jgi:hypothetical protein